MLKDKIKLKKGERRGEEGCGLLNGGLWETEGICRAKDNTKSKPEKQNNRRNKGM